MTLSEALTVIESALQTEERSLDLSVNESAVSGPKLDDHDISEMLPRLVQMPKLRSLNLYNNNISDVSFLSRLSRLHKVVLDRNRISDVSTLRQSPGLKELHLRYNKISNASAIRNLSGLSVLDLRDNELLIPEEILSNTNDAQQIINFLDDYYTNQIKKLNEAKLVVVGEANVGKTCVVNRLIRNQFVPTQSTHGIQIEKWTDIALQNGERVQMNVWDFGGQEIMHSTHQFFFTKRTVYILVVNARENEDVSKAEEWLLRIQNLTNDSPVLIVGNKIDKITGERIQQVSDISISINVTYWKSFRI